MQLRHWIRQSSFPVWKTLRNAAGHYVKSLAVINPITRIMSTFNLPDISPEVPVKLPSGLSEDQVFNFPAFKTWLSSLQKSLKDQHRSSHPFHGAPYKLREIEIQSYDHFGSGRLGFLKLKAKVTNDIDEKLSGSVFLRGGSVAMLLVLQPSDMDSPKNEEYVILTLQPRVPAGSLSFVELPAGMVDDSGTFSGAAAKEIKEETGLEIEGDELIDMTALVLKERAQDLSLDENHLQDAIYPSPGGSDEFIPLFLVRKKMERKEIEALRGKLTGLRSEGEKITLKIVRLEDVWQVAARDAKTLAAVALFEGLRKEGRV